MVVNGDGNRHLAGDDRKPDFIGLDVDIVDTGALHMHDERPCRGAGRQAAAASRPTAKTAAAAGSRRSRARRHSWSAAFGAGLETAAIIRLALAGLAISGLTAGLASGGRWDRRLHRGRLHRYQGFIDGRFFLGICTGEFEVREAAIGENEDTAAAAGVS